VVCAGRYGRLPAILASVAIEGFFAFLPVGVGGGAIAFHFAACIERIVVCVGAEFFAAVEAVSHFQWHGFLFPLA
jgi:hypothetical protein